MFNELNLQNFDSLIDKCRMDFQRQVHVCDNGIVQHFVVLYLHLMWFYVIQSCVTVLLYISISLLFVIVCFVIILLFFMLPLFYGLSAWNKDLLDWLDNVVLFAIFTNTTPISGTAKMEGYKLHW